MVYEKMLIRFYQPGEEATLRKVFYSSVHNLSYQYYSSEQLNAWASTIYIDHFFVTASHARKGIGSALMLYIHKIAKRKCIEQLSSDVSFSAESFFAFHGFKIEKRNLAIVKGVELKNTRMIKILD